METQEGKVYNVKFILNNGEETPEVVDVTPVVETVEDVEAEVEITEEDGEIGANQTTIKTDTTGNIITISTSEQEIKTNEAVKTTVETIVKEHPEYTGYTVKYVKTVNFGLVEEVMTTLINPTTGVIDLKAVTFYNK